MAKFAHLLLLHVKHFICVRHSVRKVRDCVMRECVRDTKLSESNTIELLLLSAPHRVSS